MRHALAAEPEPLNQYRVISAGVSAYEGDPASANAVRALAKVKLDISTHRSQSLRRKMLDEAMAVLCMTEQHRLLIRMNHPDSKTPVFLFRELMHGAAKVEIPDPFGQDLAAYETCRDSMVEAIPGIIAYLRKQAGLKS